MTAIARPRHRGLTDHSGGLCDDYCRCPDQRVAGDRAPAPIASSPGRQHGRDADRMVRLPALRHRDRAGIRQALFSPFEPDRRRARGVQRVLHRLCRAPDRCGDLWPLGRPHRPQGDTHRNAVDHRNRHGRRRAGADLRLDRHLGCDPLDHHSPHPGDRCWRRVGRLGPVGDGMGADHEEPRFLIILAAIRRACRVLSGQSRSAVLQLAHW